VDFLQLTLLYAWIQRRYSKIHNYESIHNPFRIGFSGLLVYSIFMKTAIDDLAVLVSVQSKNFVITYAYN